MRAPLLNSSSPGLTGRSSTPRPLGLTRDVSGILDRPPSRTMTAEDVTLALSKHAFAISRRDSPEFCQRPPSKNKRAQGRPGASAHPRPVCIGSKHTVVTTGGAGSSGLPCAMVLTAYIVLSPGTGLSCPRHFRELPSRKLSASVGALGPHDFAVRESVARLATPPRPPHPAPRS